MDPEESHSPLDYTDIRTGVKRSLCYFASKNLRALFAIDELSRSTKLFQIKLRRAN